MVRKERVVDDVLRYDTDVQDHWWRTIEYLILVGKNGVILNPDKLRFARRTVDFAGFRVTDTTIEPLPKYLDAIRDFPTPTSVTDIRSWFGLVNQVANYAQLRDLMAPFRPFRSPKCTFYWNDELESSIPADCIPAVQGRHYCGHPTWSGNIRSTEAHLPTDGLVEERNRILPSPKEL